jgi:hypothetical protein
MSVDFIKNPKEDVAPIKLDFYKPATVEQLKSKIQAGQIVIEEKTLEVATVVPVVIPEIVIAEPVIEEAVEETLVVDSGVSEEVAKAINKGRR